MHQLVLVVPGSAGFRPLAGIQVRGRAAFFLYDEELIVNDIVRDYIIPGVPANRLGGCVFF